MNTTLTKEGASGALKEYNKEPFHILHALTAEGIMCWFIQDQGHREETDSWGTAGLLHNIDFEMYPEQYCAKAPELLKEAGAENRLIHVVYNHEYDLVSDMKPEHQMKKILSTSGELTDLIRTAARMRPSGSVTNMEVSDLRRKFKDKRLATGYSRDVVKEGAEELGWTLEESMDKTIQAMCSYEATASGEMKLYEA